MVLIRFKTSSFSLKSRYSCCSSLADHSESSIKRILDAGANAILVPQVNNFDQVQDIIKYSYLHLRVGEVVVQILPDFGYKQRIILLMQKMFINFYTD